MTEIKLSASEQRLLDLLKTGQPMRYSDLRAVCNSNRPIKGLIEKGIIDKLPLGVYSYLDLENDLDTSFESFAALSVARPDALICLESAAAFHGLTVQNPSEILAAFPYNSSLPRTANAMAIRGSRWTERSMTVGVEQVNIMGVQVSITNPARTVIDLQRFAKRRGNEETAGEVLASYVLNNNLNEIISLSRELECESTIVPRLEIAQSFGRFR